MNTLYRILPLMLLLLSGCKKDKSSPFDEVPPQLVLNGKAELRDTFKLSRTPRYTFNFEISDDRSEWTLTAKGLGESLLYYQGKIINDQEVDLKGVGKGSLEWRALAPGNYPFVLELRDPDGRTGSALVNVQALPNLMPVAVLKATQTDEKAPGQIRIDAAGSFDQDARWGGKVALYEYRIGDFYQAQVTRPQLDFIMPEPGTYRIALRVKDDEEGWSEMVEQMLVVE